MENNKSISENQTWDSIYIKIGKCIVIFQKLEMLFKYAVSRGCFSIIISLKETKDALIDQLKSNADSLSLKTMGCVGRLFCDRILADSISNTDDRELSKDEMRFNVTLSYGTKDQQIILKKKIESLILERNKIVHHLQSLFQFKASGDFEKANEYLDNICNEAQCLYEELSQFAKSIPELVKKGFSSLNDHCILTDNNNSPCDKELIVALQYYAEMRSHMNDSAGWTNLSDAGSFITAQFPSALKESKKKHKTKSLKKIVESLEVFETMTTGVNNDNISFRMKTDHWLEKNKEDQVIICKRLADTDGLIQEDLGVFLVNEASTDHLGSRAISEVE